MATGYSGTPLAKKLGYPAGTHAHFISAPTALMGWLAPLIRQDSIRDVALPMGFVDAKVCAVSERWSGLKLVIRQALR